VKGLNADFCCNIRYGCSDSRLKKAYRIFRIRYCLSEIKELTALPVGENAVRNFPTASEKFMTNPEVLIEKLSFSQILVSVRRGFFIRRNTP